LFEYTDSNSEGTGNKQSSDSTGSKQQKQQRIAAMAADTVLLDITQLYELPKIHTHKINRYPIEHAKFSPPVHISDMSKDTPSFASTELD